MRKYQLTLSRDMLTSLHHLLLCYIKREHTSDESKMHVALLAEIKSKLYLKLEFIQPGYRFTLSPAQALALRVLYIEYIQEFHSYLGNRLMQIANDIHRHYQ